MTQVVVPSGRVSAVHPFAARAVSVSLPEFRYTVTRPCSTWPNVQGAE
jgi:hypothetical protein